MNQIEEDSVLDESVSFNNGGGRGGRGGEGGHGGHGGGSNGVTGNAGEPGEPGEPGERGSVVTSYEMRTPGFALNLGTIVTVLLACIGGIVWLVQQEGKTDSLQKNQFGKDAGAQLRGELDLVRNRQIDVLARLEKFDAGGTQALVILRERVSQLAAEIAGQNTRCQDLNKTVAELQRKVIEHDVQMQSWTPPQRNRKDRE